MDTNKMPPKGLAGMKKPRLTAMDRLAIETGHEPCDGIHVFPADLKPSHYVAEIPLAYIKPPMFSTQRPQRILTQSPQRPFALFAFPLRSLR